jgi:CDGSH-type Zn-finger protein
MGEPIIKIIPNGPYRVMGPIKIADSEGGGERVVEEGKGVSLCRCGKSENKPYCDGTHGRIGFESTESCVRQSS